MAKPNTRMTQMRLKAREAVFEQDQSDLSNISTTALWEVARIAHKRGLSYDLANVVTELFRRMEWKGGMPIVPRFDPVSDTDDSVLVQGSDTADARVSETPGSVIEPDSETKPATVSETLGPSDRERRILELDAHARLKGHRRPPQREMVKLLAHEGIKCSAATVGAVRKRYAGRR